MSVEDDSMRVLRRRSVGWRSVLFNIVFYLNSMFFFIVGIPLLLLPRRSAMLGLRWWSGSSQWWLRVIVGTRLEVRGREHIPSGGAIIASKHQSAWETVVLHNLFSDPAMVLKQELTNIPLLGLYSRKYGMIPIRRDRAANAIKCLVREAKVAVAAERQVIIFPEGTRRAPFAVPDYKPGIALLYRQLPAPVVPVALNSGLYWPRRQPARYPGTIVVEFLPPIEPGLDRAQFMDALQHAVESASTRLALEAGATPGSETAVAHPST